MTTAAVVALAAPAVAQQSPAAKPAPAKPAPGKPAAPTVGEVIIQGAPPPVRTSIDRQSYSVANDLQATTGSISDALRNVPSVEVDVNGNVALRGDSNVTIMIDGKPSGRFKGEGKGQALQTLSANQIERVEVITNPSAAFNPEGSAGIINLVTKKNTKLGTSGSVRANIGSAGRQNGGLSVSRKEGKFTLTGDLFLRHDSIKQTFDSDRTFAEVGGGVTTETRDRTSGATIEVRGLRAQADYDPDDKTRISLEVDFNGFNFDTGYQVENLNRISSAGVLLTGYDSYVGGGQSRDSLEGTLSYRRKIADDHEINLSLVREQIDEDRSVPALRVFRSPGPNLFEDPETRNRLSRTQLKADYSTPLGSAKLKLGYELNADDNDYTIVFARGTPLPIAIDPARSNLFRFDQQIHAAFATYERPFGKDLTVLAGLRAEATMIDLNQVTQGQKDDNNYVRFYPSLHVNYSLNDRQRLTASYSHRVQRPQPQDYNAFRIYYDPQNQLQGNPNLKPQQTDSFELGYQYRKQGTIFLATGYYRHGEDSVNDVFRNIGNGVILQTKENIGTFQSAGVELVMNGRLPGKLSYNVSGNVLWSEIDATDLGFGASKQSGYTAFGRASLNWQATPKDMFQVQGFMNGERLLAQGHQAPQGAINLGYRHKFSDTLSVAVTVQDALDTLRFKSVIKTLTYSEMNRGIPNQRAVFLGLSYAFGGGKTRDGFDFGGGGTPGS